MFIKHSRLVSFSIRFPVFYDFKNCFVNLFIIRCIKIIYVCFDLGMIKNVTFPIKSHSKKSVFVTVTFIKVKRWYFFYKDILNIFTFYFLQFSVKNRLNKTKTMTKIITSHKYLSPFYFCPRCEWVNWNLKTARK